MAVLLPLITEQLGQALTLIVIHLLYKIDFRRSQHDYEIWSAEYTLFICYNMVERSVKTSLLNNTSSKEII
jgi:hypothetical protein